MNGQEGSPGSNHDKPFGTVDIVLLMTIAGFSDAADLATDLVFPVPIVGQTIFLANSFLISPVTWAIIQGWFIMKTHGGRASISSFTSFIPVIGGLGNIANVPGSETITTFIAIMMANHPKVTQIAAVAGAAAATGGVGTAAGAAGTGEAGAAATAAGAGTAGVAAGAETGAGAATAETAAAKEAGAGAGIPEKEVSPEALGEQKEPMAKLKEELTERIPGENGDERKKGEENAGDEQEKVSAPEMPERPNLRLVQGNGNSETKRPNIEDDSVQLDDNSNEVNLKKLKKAA